MSPSVWPMLGAVAWATNGMGHANALGDAAVAPGCDPSITADATSTYVGGVTTSYVVPTTVSAMGVVSRPVCPTIGSYIAAITGCSMTSEGAIVGGT